MIWESKIWGSGGPFVDLKFSRDKAVVAQAFNVGSGDAYYIIAVQSELKLLKNNRDCG